MTSTSTSTTTPTPQNPTSTIIIDASRVPAAPGTPAAPGGPGGSSAAARSRAAAPHARLRFSGVLRSERIKLASLRSIRLTIIVTILSGLALSGLIALMWSLEVANEGSPMFGTGAAAMQSYLLFSATFAAPFLALVFGVLGVFAISSEYSSGMILSTLVAVPKRTPVYLAKGVVLAATAASAALVIVIGGLVLAVVFLPESAAQLGSTVVISGVLGTVAYLTLIALFAYGVAALLRSTAGGIAVVAGAIFVLPIVAQVLSMTGWEWVPVVSAYLPVELGGRLSQGLGDAAVQASVSGPGFWPALVALVVWAAAATLPAAALFKRRDAR